MIINRDDEAAKKLLDSVQGILRHVGIGIAAIAAVILIFGSWFIVSPGQVAIKTRLGSLIGSYGEGLHFKLPLIESVHNFSIQIERSDIKTEAFSKDLQTMTSHLAVNHRIQQETISSLYRNLGPNYVNTIVDPIVQEIFKSITAKYSAEDIIANRMEVVKELNAQVKARLAEKEIIVTDISIVDLAFQTNFMQAVENKQVAEQQAKQAQKLVEKAKMEAESTIATARAQAESLRMQKEQVTPMLVQLKAIEKWDGHMPQYSGGGALPFINVSGK